MRWQGHSRQEQVVPIVHPYENAFLHLKKLLGLEKKPAEFIKVKATLKRFQRRHLDPDRKVHQQKPAFNFLLNKLIDTYPEIYEGEEERVRYAGAIITSIHDRKQKGRWKLTSPVLDLTQPAVASSNSNRVSGAPSQKVQAHTRKNHLPAQTPPPRKFPTRTEDHTNENAPPSRGTQTSKLHEFLTSCDPPMNWCLPFFVDSGWVSEAQLRAVACWSFGRRQALLKKILAGADGGRAVCEMDVGVLQRRFRDYFGT